MKRLLAVTVVVVMLAAASLAYAGSFADPATNFKSGDKYYNASGGCGFPGNNYDYKPYNCVCYAKWLVSSFGKGAYPGGLSLADKKSHIKTYEPKKGRVAIIAIGLPYGHAAYVADVDDSGKEKSITLYESNNPSGVERKRVLKGKDKSIKDIEKKYGIIGYWKP